MPVTLGPPDGSDPASWGHNVGAFMIHYTGWLIRGRDSGFGFTAQRRGPDRKPRGPVLEAETLDELAALLERAPPQ